MQSAFNMARMHPFNAFFGAVPEIEYFSRRRVHVFSCLVKTCKGKGKTPRCVNHFFDKGDASSTSNLHKHTKHCWGDCYNFTSYRTIFAIVLIF